VRLASPGDEPRRRQSDRDDDAPAPAGGSPTWGGEGGAGDSRGGPTTSPGEAARDPARDPEGNPELM